MKKITIIFILFFTTNLFSQRDTITVNKLKEVIVNGKRNVEKKRIATKELKIGVKEQTKNPINLTNLLRYNSPIAFRDYGNGGVSTARFRGTSASNTLVLWNGIPINAVGSGQTDFNSLSASLNDNIIVQSGGNSAEYGSGAIGGTVHLKDELLFKEHQKFQLFTSYGSYNTTSNFFKSSVGTDKWSIKLASTFNYSDNDYTYIDERYKDDYGNLLTNENGNYKNYGINFVIGYKFTPTNTLSFYSTAYYGNRFFSNGFPNPSASSERNEDFNERNLLQWKYAFSSQFKQELNLAYLTQKYSYYRNKDVENFEFGKSKNVFINHSLTYRSSNVLSFNYKTIYENINGSSSDIGTEIRNSVAFVGSVKYQPTEKLITNLQVRKEINSDFNVPLSLFVGGEYRLANQLNILANFSTNYRVPTYNEMYWPVVGNLNLIPENSKQGELGASLKNENINITSTLFYIHINDKILWLPTGGSNLWRPRNVGDVVNKGIETYVSFKKEIGEHIVDFSSNYTFTLAENIETRKVLPFAPKHLLNFNVGYDYKRMKIFIQSLYQSSVYTNPTNSKTYSVKSVNVQNLGVTFKLSREKSKLPTIGFMLNNIFNEVYYFSNLRPMPGTNFNINLNYKF
ncbi:TonB-dependent receptor plug domain-containing protein [Tenacibaculum mesophilum]|uniref:TonB-dependent receptor plug domain-containing protein n=1 Tax=Tenacibaculum mesophilum TaxID=104268 RepID=UPI00069D5134|nr:TonB-dependent receptor [Tenacibaculum mesophilum]